MFSSGYSQVKRVGLPLMKHFYKTDYSGGTQSWGISEDKNGFLYFANNIGLLRYDGYNWELFPLPGNKLVRSVLCVNDTIFVGAFEEFGYFIPDRIKGLTYKSLSSTIDLQNKNLDDIWRIYHFQNQIIFQTFTHVITLRMGKLTTYSSPEQLQFSFIVGNKYYVQSKTGRIFEFVNGKFVQFDDRGIFSNNQIWAVMQAPDSTVLVATINNGVFYYKQGVFIPWKCEANDFLKKNQIFSATRIPGGFYAFGTIQDGLLITDVNGNEIQHIDKSKGLQNNTVLSTFIDSQGNLWLGLDNGIDFIELNSPLSIINEGLGLLGSCYGVIINKSKIYVGTNGGLYQADWPLNVNVASLNKPFSRIEKTNGQVWCLNVLNGKLYCGHNFGTFLIDKEVTKISPEEGSWNFLPLRNHPDKMLVGKYNGIHLYILNNGTWQYSKHVKGFNVSSRLIVEDDNENIWMAHGYKGIFKLILNQEKDSVIYIKIYNEESNLPSQTAVNVEKIRNQIIFTTSEGIYKYNALTDKMEPYSEFNRLIGDSLNIRRMIEDPYGNLWILTSDNIKFLQKSLNGKFTLKSTPFARFGNSFIQAFENIYIYDTSNIFVGTDNGVLHYDLNFHVNTKATPLCFIKGMWTLTPSTETIFQDYSGAEVANIVLPFKKNSIRFVYTYPQFTELTVSYSTRLKGYDNTWSDWSNSPQKEYTNLPPGTYTFSVKARDVLKNESKSAKFTFVIDYPWYLKPFAWVIYVIILFAIFMFLRFIVRRRVRIATAKIKEKQQLENKMREEAHKREVLEAEREIIRLRNENLQVEVDLKKKDLEHKNRELASIALHITHKNTFLIRVKNRLEAFVKKTGIESKNEILNLIKTIDTDIKLDNEWQRFELHFDEVHSDFTKKLKSQFPQLTPNDLKLCAYLRLNMSSKDIAQIMNISIRGVEISRYRLRKKLGIDSETNLIEYMMKL